MIESNIIKRFIVKCFMQNSESNIEKIAEDAFDKLSKRFLLNENVIIPSMDENGKIIKCSKETYLVQLNNNRIEVPFKEIQRKSTFSYSDVYALLDSITKMTPLGRIVIENVFEKISEPGFGLKKDNGYNRNYNKTNLQAIQRRPEKGFKGSPFQNVEIKNQFTQPSQKSSEPQKSKINLENFKKLTVAGFEGTNLAILLKLYTFINAFKQDIGFSCNKIQLFGEMLTDSEYNSEILMKIHKLFIEAIEKDISFSGYRFINEMTLSIDRLPQYNAEPSKDQKKKRITMDIENWKLQVKNFIHNFSIDVNSEKPHRFVECFKKEAILDLKLEFLDFLYKIFAYTDTFAEMVHSAVSHTRATRALNDNTKKINEEQVEDSSAANDQSTFILDNPLIANIGKFKNYVLFMTDKSIILGDKTNFYILDGNDANLVLKELNILSKVEKNTINNLRTVTAELYSSK